MSEDSHGLGKILYFILVNNRGLRPIMPNGEMSGTRCYYKLVEVKAAIWRYCKAAIILAIAIIWGPLRQAYAGPVSPGRVQVGLR